MKQNRDKAFVIFKNLAIVCMCLGVAILITELFHYIELGPQNTILLFVLAIFLIAVWTDGYFYCIAAALAGVFIFDYLITEPRLGFSFTLGFPITLTIMLIVALITSSITARMRQLRKDAVENTQQRQEAIITAEVEKARNKFLRAVSHDLRTPLTSMLGASAILMEKDSTIDQAMRQKLASDIYEDAEWLLNMIQNILSTTRLQADGVVITKEPEALEEIVADSVSIIRKRFPQCSIQVDGPPQLIVVPMDATLVSQVISNLLENAFRHAGNPSPQVHIGLSEAAGYAWVTVTDNGPGLPDRILETLFEQQVLPDQKPEASRGFGMGLSICKAIVEAHHGTIEGGNRPQGGAEFRFSLPVEEKT